MMENRPLRPHRDLEGEMARKHERERVRLDSWSARTRYYERCEKQNAKFEQFTSPRYYEENNRLYHDMKTKRDKEELLELRRDKLRKLFMEDQQTYDIETMMVNCTPRSWDDVDASTRKEGEIPLELLKKVHEGVKVEEEQKQRLRAEGALYEQWRRDEPALKDCMRRRKLGEIKMSWLDQQIEKRMAKEKEEEEMRQFIKERQKVIEEQQHEEESFKKEAEEKREALRKCLEQQMDEILRREEASNKLRREEEAVRLKRLELQDLESKWVEDERKRRTEQIALENQRFHRQKLQLKAQQVVQQLEEDRVFVQQLKDADLCDKVRNEVKRAEIQSTMNEYLGLVNDLKDLEVKRKSHMQITFDSEAGKVFQQFHDAWRKEEDMRRGLMQGILADLRKQIDDNLEKSREEQRELLREREEMIKRMQEQKAEMETQRKWEVEKKEQYRKCLDSQVASKRRREKDLKKLEREQNSDEFERLRNEESRLKNEILKMQKGQSVPSYGRRRFFH